MPSLFSGFSSSRTGKLFHNYPNYNNCTDRQSKRASALPVGRVLALRNMRPALLHLVAYLNFQLFGMNHDLLLTFWAVNRTILKNGLYEKF